MGDNKADNSGKDPRKKTTNLNDMILGGLKSRSGKETTRWINDLTHEGLADAVAASAQAVETPPNNAITSSLVTWSDKLFDLFQQYEVEFNRAMPLAEFKMEVERPVIGADLIARMQSSEHLHFSGRLHSHNISLLIRGNLQVLEGYILPSDHLIAFSGNESAYVQYFQVLPVWERSEMKLDLNGTKIAYGDLPSFAKQLFGGLVRVVKGDARDSEPFVYGGKSQVAQDVPFHSNVFESPGGNLATPALAAPPPPSLSPSIPTPVRSAPVSSAPVPTAPVPTEAPAESVPPSKNVSPQQDVPQQPNPAQRQNMQSMPQSQNVLESPTKPMAAFNPAPSLTAVATKVEELGKVSSPEGIDMHQACDILLQAVDRELEHLSGTGAKAFERRDLATVEMALKKSTKLKELHDHIHTTVNEWKRLLSEV